MDVFNKNNPHNTVRMYAIIDNQSNRSLASPDFFRIFNITDRPESYSLSTCAGQIVTSGRRAKGFIAQSVHGDIKLELPELLECDHIPNDREEIPTPEVTMNYPHLVDITGNILPMDENCQILLLIGRDLIVAHHVLDQRVGKPNTSYAGRLKI